VIIDEIQKMRRAILDHSIRKRYEKKPADVEG
jgi:hypothetical protein